MNDRTTSDVLARWLPESERLNVANTSEAIRRRALAGQRELDATRNGHRDEKVPKP